MISLTIKGIREENKLSQKQLARRANISATFISKIETNKAQNVPVIFIGRIAKALQVPLSVIIGDIDIEEFKKLRRLQALRFILKCLNYLRRR